jgi:Regulator of ribonuclease activity B
VKKTLGLAATLVIALSCGPIQAQPAPPAAGEHITRAQIERMFAELEVRPGFFPKGNLRWSYFFLGTDRAKLEKAAEQLMAQGYTLVGIEPVQTGIPNIPDTWELHVERLEHHTADTLLARDEAFYAFAAQQGLERYDGVEAAPGK